MRKLGRDYLLTKNSLCWLSHWRNGPLSDEFHSIVIDLEYLAVFFSFLSPFKARSGLVRLFPPRRHQTCEFSLLMSDI